MIPSRLKLKSSPFGNVVVVRDGDEAKPEFQKLKAAITSPEVKKFIEEKYKGRRDPGFLIGRLPKVIESALLL